MPKQIWDAALGELQLQVSKPNYNTWLKETTGISYQDDVFTIGVPNAFVAEWLANRLYSLVKKTLAGIIGKQVEVQILIQPHSRTETYQPQAYLADGGTSTKLMEPLKATSFDPTHSLNYLAKDPPKTFSLNPRYTLNTFITGECNRMAYAAAVEIAEGLISTYNPLFIYGDTGMGKTHLLQGIAHAAKARGLRTLYLSAERFTSEFVLAIKAGSTEDFRRKFRNIDVLLLDDLHFLSGKAQTQECAFHTFNELYDNNCRIVVTSDRPPKALSALQRKLRSRLAAGLVVELQPPDMETRLAILDTKSKSLNANVPAEVLRFLALQFPHNVRELEGALNKVATYAKLSRLQLELDMQFAKKAVGDLLPSKTEQSSAPSPNQILQAVASYYGIAPGAITGKQRDKKTALTRQLAMYLLREQNHYSLAEIGKILGDRDHTTILHGHKKITIELKTNASLAKAIDDIRQELKSQLSSH